MIALEQAQLSKPHFHCQLQSWCREDLWHYLEIMQPIPNSRCIQVDSSTLASFMHGDSSVTDSISNLPDVERRSPAAQMATLLHAFSITYPSSEVACWFTGVERSSWQEVRTSSVVMAKLQYKQSQHTVFHNDFLMYLDKAEVMLFTKCLWGMHWENLRQHDPSKSTL